MKRGPQTGKKAVTPSAMLKATEAWGEDMPAEVRALATACDAATASAVATKLGYSGATISYVLGNRYAGDKDRVFAKVRGLFMAETVMCPVLGEIGRHRCLDEQKRPFASTNSIRARLFHACKTCPENRQNKEASDV